MRNLLLVLFITFSHNLYSKDCYENKTFSLLTNQIGQIKNLINGEASKGSIFSVFGEGFVLDDTPRLISELEKQISERKGISLEHELLHKCLQDKKIKKAGELSDLSIELTKLKIELLKKNKNLNNAIVKKIEGENQVPEIKEEIEKENKANELAKKVLTSEVLEAESTATISTDLKVKRLAAYRSELTKLKIELLNKKIEHNKALESKLKYFEDQSEFLSSVLVGIEGLSEKEVAQRLKKTEEIWIEISSRNYNIFSAGESFQLPQIPSSTITDTGREDLKKEVSDLNSLNQELVIFKQKTLTELTSKKNHELKLHNDLLLQVNNVRGVLYNLVPSSFVVKQALTIDYYKKLIKEVAASPFRILSYFYSKFLYIRDEVSKGNEGFKTLGYDIVYLSFLALILFAIKTVFSNSKQWVDGRFISFFSKFRSYQLVKGILSLWNKIKDNTEDFLWLGLIYFIREQDFLSDVRIVLDIFQVIFISRILKSGVILFFGSISRIDVKSFAAFKRKAQLAAKYFTNIYLFYALSLIFVDATIGRTYIFSIVKYTVIFYSIFRLVVTSSDWEKEFWVYIEKNFSGFIVSRLEGIFKFFPQKLRATTYFVIIILFSILNLFIRATENFEISKKISANIFKKQIERVEAENGSDEVIPEEYAKYFQLNSIENEQDYVCVSETLENSIIDEMKEWITDKSEEHSLVVFGDKGVGKTTLLKHCLETINGEFSEQVRVIKTKIPAKVLNKKDLQNFICRTITGKEMEGSFDLYQLDKALDKKVIIFFDEAQNSFLSQVGGFDAYEYLLNLLNFNTENIYWVMSLNKYSWLYLDRAFGRNQFFRNVFEIKGWSDLKIKELIMSRHSKTDYSLSFDLLINATRSQDEIDRYASVESKFFKLLWELSRGNPRAALYLWMTALSRKRLKTFNVNIPKEVDLAGLEKLPDDLMFVIAHVLKHENLTAKEIEHVTNLPNGIVRNAIKVGLEKNFLFKDERNRYMIDIASQYGVIKFLTLKNFIYGS
ncbi:MAG: hypothetical protein CME70_16365 [Halobacteriovorax sp.]|nr:hypothetical protein [Halobacteriovorax sp.]|tara:strand:+ start:9651 stop:12674 length:3024 start_codon:yes stop_codon:yes gene_type:complete